MADKGRSLAQAVATSLALLAAVIIWRSAGPGSRSSFWLQRVDPVRVFRARGCRSFRWTLGQT